MCSQVDSSRPFILVGVSLGGIMSIEMAQHIQPQKIIIISSIKTAKEKPFYFSFGKLFSNIALITPVSLPWLWLIARTFFGRMKKREFDIFRDMLIKTGAKQIRWAQNAIVKWNRTGAPSNLIHIHGTADRVFPIMFIKNYIPVKGGTHYMVIRKAAEISRILGEVL